MPKKDMLLRGQAEIAKDTRRRLTDLETKEYATGVLTEEQVQDYVGGMVTGNTETGVAVTYDDTGGKLNFDAQTAGDARYAPIAKGVTNGDSHDHNSGDGNQVNHTTLSNIGSNSHATIDSHIAATAAHGATGAVVGETNTQTLTNKTLTAPTIADFTNAQHDHGDADDGGALVAAALSVPLHGATEKTTIHDDDEFGGIDTENSNALTWWKWSTLKTALTTLFSTLYVALTGDQTVAGVKTLSDGLKLGAGTDILAVYDQGTWVPDITGSSSNPTVTYSAQTGRNTRIGDKIDYNLVIVVNTISGGSGDVRISLPVADGTGSGAVAPVTFATIDIPGTPINVVFRTVGGQAYGRIIANQDNALQQVVQVSALAAGSTIVVQGVFFT